MRVSRRFEFLELIPALDTIRFYYHARLRDARFARGDQTIFPRQPFQFLACQLCAVRRRRRNTALELHVFRLAVVTALRGRQRKFLAVRKVIFSLRPSYCLQSVIADKLTEGKSMILTYEKKDAMTFIGYHTAILPGEGYQKCPEFWNKEEKPN